MVAFTGSCAAVLVAACLAAVPGTATGDDERRGTAASSRPYCQGKPATMVGTVGDDTLTGTVRADVIVTGEGNDTVTGRGGADRICVGPGDDTVVAGAGADVIAGGGGSDIVLAGTGDDRMLGGGGMDGLLGMAGDDLYRGDANLDIAAFLAAPAGVTADLATGRAKGEGVDSLVGIEALMGSDFDDALRGDSGFNALFSGTGADLLDGRAGNDFILLGNAPGPVEIDLGDDRYTGGGLAPNVENVVGSPFDDVIYGDSGYNYLDGAEGTDAIDGIDGSDLCLGETLFNCREFHASDSPPQDTGADPLGVAARVRGAMEPVGRPGPPPVYASYDSPTQWGFTNCPMFSSQALIGTHLLGRGYFASRSSLGFGGYTNWRYSPLVYLDQSSYWVWYGGLWYGPFDKAAAGGYQWTQDIGASLTAYGWFYSVETQQYYSLGSCNGNGALPGF